MFPYLVPLTSRPVRHPGEQVFPKYSQVKAAVIQLRRWNPSLSSHEWRPLGISERGFYEVEKIYNCRVGV